MMIVLIAVLVTAVLANSWWGAAHGTTAARSAAVLSRPRPQMVSGMAAANWWQLAGLLVSAFAYFAVDPRVRSPRARRWNCLVCGAGAALVAVASFWARDWFLGMLMAFLCLAAVLRGQHGLRDGALQQGQQTWS